MTGASSMPVPFAAHVALLRGFLAQRSAIVDSIQNLLNARRKSVQYLQDRALLSRGFEDCFFAQAAVGAEEQALRGQLEQAHWACGFRPRQTSALFNDLIHPAEMMIRGFFCWQQTRWPGRNGRVHYAQTLFNVYVLRNLELLSMRLWDDGQDAATGRLVELQALLDALWANSPADQPRLVRDARWLVPLAQSPTTDDLAPYFGVAESVAATRAEADRQTMQMAAVAVIGGHLRSQIRHYCLQDAVAVDDASVVRRTRTSNALDFALLVQGLAALLEAYEHAVRQADAVRRLGLAGTILQGLSPDPEVFLNRVDLLGAYSMIEHLFVTTDARGRVDYTPAGRRHLRLLAEYEAGIVRVSRYLLEDCANFRPEEGRYSPYGAIFGTPSNLTEHMALKAIERDAETRFSLEDVFVDGEGDKLAWVNGWRRLPHIDAALQESHDYPHDFAQEMFARIEVELHRAVELDAVGRGATTGRLAVITDDGPQSAGRIGGMPRLPVRFVVASDATRVAAGAAVSCDESQLRRDRFEGHFAVSFETDDGWVGIRKDFLTDVLGAGQDASVDGLTPAAARILRLTCPGLVAADTATDQASTPPSILKA